MFHKKLKFILPVIFAGACLLGGCGNTANDNTAPAGEDTSKTTNRNTSVSDTPQKLTANYVVCTDTSTLDASYSISDNLYGIFLEDINHALDGGMYAELVKNNSFEYGSAASNGNKHGWSTTDPTGQLLIFDIMDGTEDKSYLHEQNIHYTRLTNASNEYQGIYNKGYLAGMSITPGDVYNLSLYAKTTSYSGQIRITLRSDDGTIYAQDYITPAGSNWSKYNLTLTPTTNQGTDAVTLQLVVEITQGSIDLDMISLMPAETYKGTAIRKDIGEMLEALNPSFLRFPGGCVVEGRDAESIYSWKDSIGNGASLTVDGVTTVGDIAVRPQGRSIWQGTDAHPYYTTYGIGFYEFFELCEVLDCMPVPVLNAGMTCPIQSAKYQVFDTDSEEFKQCVQDALDLVEFCRGGADTTWGSVRIAMGHKEPFALKYVGIGNEQWQTEYFEHYRLFVEAFNEAAAANPQLFEGIELIVANGPASGDRFGWNYMKDCGDFGDKLTTLVDEHYYEAPSFFFANTHRYDSYDRDSQAAVFLGEYAAQSNTLEAALAEAAYMTGLEKNADIIEMACYAPLFGNQTQTQWAPDLIWYNSDMAYGSVNYYVQQLFSQNKGVTNLPTTLESSEYTSKVTLSGKAGLGSWMTSVAYDNLTITDNATGKVLYACDFEDKSVLEKDFAIQEGDWEIKDGRLYQYNISAPSNANTGDALYFGDKSWTNYTLTVEGEILEGPEGFLIPVCVADANNTIFWNIGGWGNSLACLQIVKEGSKSGQISGTVKNMKLSHNKKYTIKMVVDGNHIMGYLNDMKYLDYTVEAPSSLYETASVDANGDIILKIVNPTDTTAYFSTTLKDFDASAYECMAELTTLAGETLGSTNTYETPDKMVPVTGTLEIAPEFNYEAPKYSLSIIRIRKK